LIWYHATPTRRLSRVLSSGLRTKGVRGASTASRGFTRGRVYLWAGLEEAREFVEEAYELSGIPDWTILEVDLPEDYEILEDEEVSADLISVYVTRDIPPQYLRPLEHLNLGRLMAERERTFSERFPEYKIVPKPFWALGSRGEDWIGYWEVPKEHLEHLKRIFEGVVRRYPKDSESREILSFLEKLSEGSFSEEDLRALKEGYPKPTT